MSRIQQGSRFAATALAVLMTTSIPAKVALTLSDDEPERRESPAAVSDDPSMDRRTYPRASYVWPYGSGPDYRGEASLEPGSAGVVTTAVGLFRVGFGMPVLPAELRKPLSTRDPHGRYLFLLASDRDAVPALRRTIVRDGGHVVAFNPNSSVLIARVSDSTRGELHAGAGVVAVEPYHPALKLHPLIGRTPLTDATRALSEVYELEILLFPGEEPAETARGLAQLGGNVLATSENRRFPKITIEIHRSRLAEVAALEPVMLVLEHLPWQLFSEETTTTIQTGQYNRGATPYHDAGIDGGGGGVSYGFCSLASSVGCTTIGGDSCTTGQGTCATETTQVLMIVDNGIQLDAGDLSHGRTDSGWQGASVVSGHRKVLAYETTVQFAGQGDLRGCDLSLNGARTHGHVVAATAVGNATDVAAAYGGPGWVATDEQGRSWALDGVAPRGLLVAFDAQITPGAAACETPTIGLDEALKPGALYISGGDVLDGSLEKAHALHGARSFNLSIGKPENIYGDAALEVDEFLFDHRDAMVFVAAGNRGRDDSPPGGDGRPDPLTLQEPATSKNALAIGASQNADRTDRPNARALFSSTGPAVNDSTVNRMAPHLMAPGTDSGTLGLLSEFACRSNDNDSDDPVECDISAGNSGTSFAAPAAAGAGMLVRDYFVQGFYSAGRRDPGHAVPEVSGALVKAALIASADFMTGINLARTERFNFEQGYGRIQLDRGLPLETWAGTPSGIAVVDTLDGAAVLNDLGGTITGTMTELGAPQVATFDVCNDKEPLTAVLTWIDPVDVPIVGALVNDLNLRLTAPSGVEYRGNYFSDDNNRDGALHTTDEDCPGIGGIGFDQQIDEGPWALPVCSRTLLPGTGTQAPELTDFDSANVTEAVFLSPNAHGDPESPSYVNGICTPGSTGGEAGNPCGHHLDCSGNDGYQICDAESGSGDCCDGGDLQTEPGSWTIEISRGNELLNPTDFSIVVVGGICRGSSALLGKSTYRCNDDVEVVIKEDDPGIAASTIANRTLVRVVKPDGTIVDEESVDSTPPLEFRQDSQRRFASVGIPISPDTTPDPGNGVLDVNDGDSIEVIYADLESGQLRTARAVVDCTLDLTVGLVVNPQFGQDSAVALLGGCERNLRGRFELAGIGGLGGFPDRYPDAGERVQLDFVFQSDELDALDSVDVGLSCVVADADSPEACLADGTNCTSEVCSGPCDPRRENNPSCDGTVDDGTSQTLGPAYMTVLDPEKSVGFLPGLSTLGVRFSIEMAADDQPGDPFFGAPQPSPTVELLLRVSDPASGRSRSGLGVHRLRLNVDESSIFYSTDFPLGGTDVQILDLNENEVAEDPIYDPLGGLLGLDYRFETQSFGNLLVGRDADGNTVDRNRNLESPWNFDGGDGGFTSGLGAATDEDSVTDAIYNWGEDENFNGIEDGECLGDRSIRCYAIGPAGTDPRCAGIPGFPGNRKCISIEDRAGDGSGSGNFARNRSTLGGCGWQTRAPSSCSASPTRGCFTNDDCTGVCINASNSIHSTFDGCTGDPDCGETWECSTAAPIEKVLGSCGTCSISGSPCRDRTNGSDCPASESCDADDGRCGGILGACVAAQQICEDAAGDCTGGPTAGGVWHTGTINEPVAIGRDDSGCFGPDPTNDCQSYGFISGTGRGFEWWSLLLTPVMQKVNQEVDPATGSALATAEITRWAWNQTLDLPDNNVQYTWELDTDTSKLLPVDLTSDATVLNSGGGRAGAFSRGNPTPTGGWPLFAPMGTCGVTTCGGRQLCDAGGDGSAAGSSCAFDSDCDAIAGPGALCNVPDSQNRCESVVNCAEGGCNLGVCDRGRCEFCDPPGGDCSDLACSDDDDCLNAAGQTGNVASCTVPAPNTIACGDDVGVNDCDTGLGATGAVCVGIGDPCFFAAECASGSACANPTPEPCAHTPTPGSEAPCSTDDQCIAGECTVPAAPGIECRLDSECESLAAGSLCGDETTVPRPETCLNSPVSVNGLVGLNREGQNACFFQGTDAISAQARRELRLAGPLDNDRDDDLDTRVCAGDASTTCIVDEDCSFKRTTGPCVAQLGDGVDEYVTANGPRRNFDLTDRPSNGPDLRLFTLEDIYGKTGNSYQGAIGFVNRQGSVGFPAVTGFGQAIDDMVVEWREFTLEPDQTDCGTGSCATVLLDTDRVFIGEQIVDFRVLDPSPYGYFCDATGAVCYPADPGRSPCGGLCGAGSNDCDGNGRFDDAVDDDDCNDDGRRDVRVVLSTEAEPVGEVVFADETSAGSGAFLGSIIVSALADTPGVLFLAQDGVENPTIQARYLDHDDGTGTLCENSILPDSEGEIVDTAEVFLDTTCAVLVSGYQISDNGDGDDYADTNETATITLEVENHCGFELTNCAVRISSNDPDVECILNPVQQIALIPCQGKAPCTLPAGTSSELPPFQWRVDGQTETTAPFDPATARFTMTMSCDEIAGLSVPQSIELPLDLDIEFDPADQTTWSEGFEGSLGGALGDGGTAFHAQNNDAGIPGNSLAEGLANGDGYRCQYSDPDWPNSGSSGDSVETNCFPAFNLAHANTIYWQIDGQNIAENMVDAGRAKEGTRSMYYGVYDQVPLNPEATDPFVFTSPQATIEAAGTTEPISLGVVPPPVLSWWQQVSLMDGRRLYINTTRSADRGIVQIQLADTDGAPVGDWIKLEPFRNGYDTQAFSNFFNCSFDPIDDGNTEDDFFDPTDPNRRLGPSSTCFGSTPGGMTDFSWTCMGDTDAPFDSTESCHALVGPDETDRPTWPPNPTDITGTWVEARVDLAAYKGRRARFRFLVASIKFYGENWEINFQNNPDAPDDGWWIDDIRIDSALLNPAELVPDTNANDSLAPCGAACTSVSAFVTVSSEQSTCDAGGGGSALGQPCATDGDCAAIAPGSSCTSLVDPGTVVLDTAGRLLELNAAGTDSPSVADACHSGGLQYRFSIDDTVARDWTADPVFVDAPSNPGDTVYDVDVRCSTLTMCTDRESVTVTVDCPATGKLRRFASIFSSSPGEFFWEALVPATDRNPEIPGEFQVYRGAVADLPDYSTGSIVSTGLTGTVWIDGSLPAGSSYYLFARDGSQVGLGCNEIPFSWNSGGDGQVDRDGNPALPAP